MIPNPDENLREQRRFVQVFQAMLDSRSRAPQMASLENQKQALRDFVDVVRSMDEHLSSGGALPDDWSKIRVGIFRIDRKDEEGLTP